MVLKFNEYINERLFNKSIDRVKSGEVRKEDRLGNTNLYDLKPIDIGLPFLISNDYFEVDGNRDFTRDEMSEYYPHFVKAGWKVMNLKDVEVLQKYIGNHNKSNKYKPVKDTNYVLDFELDEFKYQNYGGGAYYTKNKNLWFDLTDKTTQETVEFLFKSRLKTNAMWLDYTDLWRNKSFYFELITPETIGCYVLNGSNEHNDTELIRLVKKK